MIRAIAVTFVLIGPVSLGAAEPEKKNFELTLQEAYKKEFAFLVGQQRQLETRVKEVDARIKREQASLQSEMAKLENRVIAVDGLLQDARKRLEEVEQNAAESTDDELLIQNTLEQAVQSLREYDVDLDVPEDNSALGIVAETVFSEASDVLGRLSKVRREDGEFFLLNGTKVQGQIIYIGRIAAYGVSALGSGALAPVGGGKLKLRKENASTAAQALASGQSVPMLPIFLYESLSKAVDEDVDQTILEHVDAGGAIAWVIVVLGLIGLALAIIRAIILGTCTNSSDAVEAALASSARAGDARAVLEEAKTLKGSAPRVVSAVFRSIREGSERYDEAIAEGLIAESRRWELFGTAILVIAAVAPLLGLLGTVTGMIATFDIITKYGTGDPKLLSGGISTALITTELGLIVAIPTLLLGNLLKGWAGRVEAEAERSAIRMITLYTGKEVTATSPAANLATSARVVAAAGSK